MATRNAKNKEAAKICSEEQATMLDVIMRDVIVQKAQSNLEDSKAALKHVQDQKQQTNSTSTVQFPAPMQKREVQRYIVSKL